MVNINTLIFYGIKGRKIKGGKILSDDELLPEELDYHFEEEFNNVKRQVKSRKEKKGE